MASFRVIDSHTGGEPTRTIVEGGPPLTGETVSAKLSGMKGHRDGFRSRGEDAASARAKPDGKPKKEEGMDSLNREGSCQMLPRRVNPMEGGGDI